MKKGRKSFIRLDVFDRIKQVLNFLVLDDLETTRTQTEIAHAIGLCPGTHMINILQEAWLAGEIGLYRDTFGVRYYWITEGARAAHYSVTDCDMPWDCEGSICYRDGYVCLGKK